MTPKIDIITFNDFYAKFAKGEFPHQRLGQAFVNTFTRGSEPCPDIFYESNEKEAIRMIFDRYVIQE